MATVVMLKHKDSGVIKRGYYGFSWTTLFFGFFPALFRSDFQTFIGAFVVMLILGLFTFGVGAWIAAFAWAFLYNGYYTRKLLERGYVIADSEGTASEARARLRIA